MPGFRDQEVRFPFAQGAAEVNRTERARQLAVVRGVPVDRWAQPSRCTGWTVHDVVRHVVQMNELQLDTIEAARAGWRAERLRGFDPKTTPQAWLGQVPPVEPAPTLADYERTTNALTEAVAALEGSDVVMDSPTGRQPWPRVVLHGLFDALVHERDVTEPLGCSAPAAPGQLPVLAYALLLAARVACVFDHEFAVTLDPGAQAVRVGVRGAAVEVAPAADRDDAVPVDPLRLLDALAGRGPLRDALPAPDPVVTALGLLGRSL
jgi:uncharacterized protein (TIGR03083 family)